MCEVYTYCHDCCYSGLSCAWNQTGNNCYYNEYLCAPSLCPEHSSYYSSYNNSYNTSDIIFLAVSSTVVPIIFILSLFCIWYKYSYLKLHCTHCKHNHRTPSRCDTTVYTKVTKQFTEARLKSKPIKTRTIIQEIKTAVIEDGVPKISVVAIEKEENYTDSSAPNEYEDIIVEKQESIGIQCECDKFKYCDYYLSFIWVRDFYYSSFKYILILFFICIELQIILMIVLAFTVDGNNNRYTRFLGDSGLNVLIVVGAFPLLCAFCYCYLERKELCNCQF